MTTFVEYSAVDSRRLVHHSFKFNNETISHAEHVQAMRSANLLGDCCARASQPPRPITFCVLTQIQLQPDPRLTHSQQGYPTTGYADSLPHRRMLPKPSTLAASGVRCLFGANNPNAPECHNRFCVCGLQCELSCARWSKKKRVVPGGDAPAALARKAGEDAAGGGEAAGGRASICIRRCIMIACRNHGILHGIFAA